ncbi:class I SAM-dependent methyltransferase [Tropicimonas sp. IMCC6043]|uniref:class I SAM-dependent methyltransferase n=1 Tax=Tropicimonas sp. IMCC6043 TaxID=2510645 RepID=UPI00101BC5CC|nr:class I SAM-dependent methyltransferase [Tropicimonas sp. IMCC6043]RYH10006.1 methyltransferase domain-containing protein [Tropicimonas sp. IMCC6043]
MPQHEPPKFFDGGGYEKMMGRWSQAAGQLFLDFLEPPRGLHWLDVGCGNGAFTELLFTEAGAAKVTGVDPSDGLLETAKVRLQEHDAELIVGDAQTLPFADQEFDAAVMALVINFLPDPPKAVSEMARVVRPGGTLSSYIWDIDGGGFTMEPIRVSLSGLGIEAPVTGPDKARLDYMEQVWRSLGLEDISSTRMEVPLIYEDFEDFWNSSIGIPNSVANAVKSLSESDQSVLKEGLRKTMATGSDGSVSYAAAINATQGRVPQRT